MSEAPPDVSGGSRPVDELFGATQAELWRLARSRLRDCRRTAVLDTTAVVHETYLRFSKSKADQRMAHVVEMRCHCGLTGQEIGEALGVTDHTVRRDGEQAPLFLAEALK